MKMEIELSDTQAEKVEILKSNGIEVGQAIDMLFDMKDSIRDQQNIFVDHKITEAQKEKEELQKKISEIDDEISLFNKLKDVSVDSTQKQKIVEKEYGKIDKTYEQSVQDAKHNFKWSKSIFKF